MMLGYISVTIKWFLEVLFGTPKMVYRFKGTSGVVSADFLSPVGLNCWSFLGRWGAFRYK
jgi:hypothetical protein